MNLLETSLRVPLLIRAAARGGTRSARVYNHPVELVDLYPTIVGTSL